MDFFRRFKAPENENSHGLSRAVNSLETNCVEINSFVGSSRLGLVAVCLIFGRLRLSWPSDELEVQFWVNYELVSWAFHQFLGTFVRKPAIFQPNLDFLIIQDLNPRYQKSTQNRNLQTHQAPILFFPSCSSSFHVVRGKDWHKLTDDWIPSQKFTASCDSKILFWHSQSLLWRL